MTDTPRHHTRRLLLSLGICIVVVLAAVAHDRLSKAAITLKPHVTYQQQSVSAEKSLAWPTTGQAAIGAQRYGVLASTSNQKPLPTASVAKLITALVVLDKKPITLGTEGSTITMTQQDVDLYNHYVSQDGSVVPVAVGEQLTEQQILEGMLLPSANNLADSLATWAFGSLSAYQAYANKWLSAQGLSQTHVGSDASGLSPDTTSTATDLVHLGELALNNPAITKIASMTSADIPIAGTVNNVNGLLGTDGINGLKTGNSTQAGGVFLFSAPYTVSPSHNVTIIGAVMQSPSLYQGMINGLTLLRSAQAAFAYQVVMPAHTTIATYSQPWGNSVKAVSQTAVSAITWQGKPLNQPTIKIAAVTPPKPANSSVGTVTYDKNTAEKTDVVLAQPITKPPILWRLGH